MARQVGKISLIYLLSEKSDVCIINHLSILFDGTFVNSVAQRGSSGEPQQFEAEGNIEVTLGTNDSARQFHIPVYYNRNEPENVISHTVLTKGFGFVKDVAMSEHGTVIYRRGNIIIIAVNNRFRWVTDTVNNLSSN